MARTTGPLLSFGASGAIAKTQVYSTWRGIQYARRYAVPANPQTVDQMSTRNVFKWANASWLYLPAIAVEPWTAYAKGRAFVARNGWVSRCVALLRSETDLLLLEGSPGVAGGLPPVSAIATAGVGTVTVAVVAPTVPSGWALTAAQGICVKSADAHLPFAPPVAALEDLTSTYSLAFTGLTAGSLYVTSSWFKWDRGGGKVAYSIGINSSATPT